MASSGGIGAGGDGDLFQQPAGLQPMHDMPQERLARDRLKDLAGQPRRTHPRLDQSDHADVLALADAPDNF